MPSLTNNKEQASNSSNKVEAEYLNWEGDDCKGETNDQDHKAHKVGGSSCSPPSLKRKQERCYTQQCIELQITAGLWFPLMTFLLKSFTVRSLSYVKATLDASEVHSCRGERHYCWWSSHRTPHLLTCPAKKRDKVQHDTRDNTSKLCICKRPTDTWADRTQPLRMYLIIIVPVQHASLQNHFHAWGSMKAGKSVPPQEIMLGNNSAVSIYILACLYMTRIMYMEQN